MRAWIFWSLKLGLGLGLVLLLLALVGLEQVGATLASARRAELAAALALAVAQVFVASGRLKLITDRQGMTLPLRMIARVTFIANFYGLFLPSEVAPAAVRWHRLARASGRGADVLAAIVLGRVLFVGAMLGLGLVCLLLDAGAAGRQGLVLLLAGLLAGMGVVALLAVQPGLLPRRRASSALGALPVWLADRVRRLGVAATSLRSLPALVLAGAGALALFENLLGLGTIVLLARAIELDLGVLTLGWIRAVVQALAMLPISPGGLGVREGGLLILLQPYGVAGASAIALSFLMLARNLVVGGIGGVLEALGLLAARTPRAASVVPKARAAGPVAKAPIIDARDVGLALLHVVLMPIAWLVPERLWLPCCLRAVSIVQRVRGPRRTGVQAVLADASASAGLPDARSIELHLAAGRIERLLQELKELRPGGWRVRIELEGAEHVRTALARGAGGIFWVAPFRSSTLIVKRGLYEAGFRVTQLSRPFHGPSRTEFGRRVLNRVRMGVEERYLGERILMPKGEEGNALRALGRRLEAGGLIAITCTPDGRRLIEQPLLSGRLPLAGGAPSLALSTGAALLPVIALREGPGRFRLVVEPPLEVPDPPDRGAAIVDLTRQYAARIEAHLRRHPFLCEAWWDMLPGDAAGPDAAPRSAGEASAGPLAATPAERAL